MSTRTGAKKYSFVTVRQQCGPPLPGRRPTGRPEGHWTQVAGHPGGPRRPGTRVGHWEVTGSLSLVVALVWPRASFKFLSTLESARVLDSVPRSRSRWQRLRPELRDFKLTARAGRKRLRDSVRFGPSELRNRHRCRRPPGSRWPTRWPQRLPHGQAHEARPEAPPSKAAGRGVPVRGLRAARRSGSGQVTGQGRKAPGGLWHRPPRRDDGQTVAASDSEPGFSEKPASGQGLRVSLRLRVRRVRLASWPTGHYKFSLAQPP